MVLCDPFERFFKHLFRAGLEYDSLSRSQRRAIIELRTTLPTFTLGWPPHERLEQLGPVIEMRASRNLSRRHLENEFQLYRGAKSQAGDPDHDPAGIFVRSEDVLQ
jgi:hypothetical protein